VNRALRSPARGEYRVFYDVDADARVVIVQAIRRKGRKTTKDVL